MYKRVSLALAALLVFMLLVACQAETDQGALRNGDYAGESQASYTAEPYWGKINFTMKGGKVLAFDFKIEDRHLNRLFDASYEEVFADIPAYIAQCRNEVKGIAQYAERFKATGDIAKVDAIAGATWSYNIFKATVKDAVAKKK